MVKGWKGIVEERKKKRRKKRNNNARLICELKIFFSMHFEKCAQVGLHLHSRNFLSRHLSIG